MLNLLNSSQKTVTWHEPIEMLYACHSKVRRFCEQLTQLPEYIKQHGNNSIAQTTAKQILTYFNQAAPLHHDDEEQNFFPLLVQYVPHAQATIDKLMRQHQNLHKNWCEMSDELTILLSGSSATLNNETVAKFVSAYMQHIDLEEPLFEFGKQHLPNDKLREIGQIMAARRQA